MFRTYILPFVYKEVVFVCTKSLFEPRFVIMSTTMAGQSNSRKLIMSMSTGIKAINFVIFLVCRKQKAYVIV